VSRSDSVFSDGLGSAATRRLFNSEGIETALPRANQMQSQGCDLANKRRVGPLAVSRQKRTRRLHKKRRRPLSLSDNHGIAFSCLDCRPYSRRRNPPDVPIEGTTRAIQSLSQYVEPSRSFSFFIFFASGRIHQALRLLGGTATSVWPTPGLRPQPNVTDLQVTLKYIFSLKNRPPTLI
jgi:hypothetical protein